MGGRFVVFGGGMERESAGPVDWMERRDTGKEFESGGGQQSLFNCAAVARAASGLARVRSGDETVKSGLERRSEEHTSELQSLTNLVCRLLLEKKKKKKHREDDDKNNTENH